tara:strand:- start:11905 stop:12201 length:297 start_codon:yes stop_codon:yes gene_type:complete
MGAEAKYKPGDVVLKPTTKDLIIFGDLLGIDVNYTSFTVKSQMVVCSSDDFIYPVSYVVQEFTYPIAYLPLFFKANGNAAKRGCKFVTRDELLMKLPT